MKDALKKIVGGRSRKVLKDFEAVYGALILLSLHWSLVVYINSSHLLSFTSSTVVGLLYMLGSVGAIILFLNAPKFLSSIGNFYTVILFTIIEIVVLIGMAFSTSLIPAACFFILHIATVPIILFTLDIFMETMIGKSEAKTGGKRGLYLSILSLAGAIAPVITGNIIEPEHISFTPVYLLSALILVPFLFVVVIFFRNFEDQEYRTLNIRSAIRSFMRKRDVRNVFYAYLHLQFFFTFTVVFMPLYLFEVIGFSWSQIGGIILAGIMAYVILEYPIGIIADKYTGEKELMALGFMIIAISTSWFAFITEAHVGTWMLVMFMTRVGASLVETTAESYFFKHTEGKDVDMISTFRLAGPLAAVVGAAVGALALTVLPFNLIFVLLSLVMIPGLFFTMVLTDTK